jgi:hypothetical protein
VLQAEVVVAADLAPHEVEEVDSEIEVEEVEEVDSVIEVEEVPQEVAEVPQEVVEVDLEPEVAEEESERELRSWFNHTRDSKASTC